VETCVKAFGREKLEPESADRKGGSCVVHKKQPEVRNSERKRKGHN
jgi:hypothetical protein